MIIALFCYELSLSPKPSLTFPWLRQTGHKQSSTALSNNSQWGTQPNLPSPLSAYSCSNTSCYIYLSHVKNSFCMDGWIYLCVYTHTVFPSCPFSSCITIAIQTRGLTSTFLMLGTNYCICHYDQVQLSLEELEASVNCYQPSVFDVASSICQSPPQHRFPVIADSFFH